MITPKMKPWMTLLAAALALFAAATPAKAETLGEILRKTGWHRIMGTWVDEDTRGAAVKTTYAWKFKDRVIEIGTKTADRDSVAIMGLNAKSGEVYLMSADNEGGGALGKWELDEDTGDAILDAGFVTEDGEEGSLRIRHHLADDDTLIVTIEGIDTPVTLTLVRMKE